jgi:hypothetical protein
MFAGGRPRVARIAYGVRPPDLNLPVSMLRRIQIWAQTNQPEYTLVGGALSAWENHYRKRVSPIEDSDESMMGRLALNEKKLIVLFAVNEMLAQPTADTISKAARLHDYMVGLYQEFGASVRETDTERIWTEVERVIRSLTSSGKIDGVTRRQLNQRLHRKYDGEQLNKAIEGMVKASILQEERTSGVGRPTTKYSLAGQV